MSETKIHPTAWKRNPLGLYEHVTYHFKDDGSVDWRKMISSEWIVPNIEKTSETDVSKLDDTKLLILLQGFKQVAKLRGYKSVDVQFTAHPDFVSAKTSIQWIPNYENYDIQFTVGAADAHMSNTTGFGGAFLTTIAENRSFVRAVRNFLDIPILGKDEIGAKGNNQPDPVATVQAGSALESLNQILSSNNIRFESFKNQMVRAKVAGADAWNTTQDIAANQVFEVTGIVQELLKKKAAQTSAK